MKLNRLVILAAFLFQVGAFAKDYQCEEYAKSKAGRTVNKGDTVTCSLENSYIFSDEASGDLICRHDVNLKCGLKCASDLHFVGTHDGKGHCLSKTDKSAYAECALKLGACHEKFQENKFGHNGKELNIDRVREEFAKYDDCVVAVQNHCLESSGSHKH